MAADLKIYRDAACTMLDSLDVSNDIGALVAAAQMEHSVHGYHNGQSQGRTYTLTYAVGTGLMTVATLDEHAEADSWTQAVLPNGIYNDELVPGTCITLGPILNDNDQSTVRTGRAFEDISAADLIEAGNYSVNESYWIKNVGPHTAKLSKLRVYPKATFANTVNAPCLGVRERAQALAADVITLTVTVDLGGGQYTFNVHSGGGFFGDFALTPVTAGAWKEIITGLDFVCDVGLAVNDAVVITVHVGRLQVELATDNGGTPGAFTSTGEIGLSSPGEVDLEIAPGEVVRAWARIVTDISDTTANNRRMFEIRADFCYT